MKFKNIFTFILTAVTGLLITEYIRFNELYYLLLSISISSFFLAAFYLFNSFLNTNKLKLQYADNISDETKKKIDKHEKEKHKEDKNNKNNIDYALNLLFICVSIEETIFILHIFLNKMYNKAVLIFQYTFPALIVTIIFWFMALKYIIKFFIKK